MFLFLSKLLPLVLYPLGLACVLMVVALFLLWKRPRWAAGAIALALVALLLGSNGWTMGWLTRSLEWQYLPQKHFPKVDAIVVLGGGIRPASPPRLEPDLGEPGDRIFYGAELFLAGKAPRLVLSGGRIEWKGGGDEAESVDMAAIAQRLGVPASAILQDPTSLNTYENAVNVRKLLDPKTANRILLVTSAMHMPRSLKIFQKQGFEVIPAPTDYQATQQDIVESQATPQGVILNLLPDADRLAQTTRALKEYLGTGIYALRGWL